MSKDQLLDVLANQVENEVLKATPTTIPRINFNLTDIKVRDSKKRLRPNGESDTA
jgi:hypothetical protein